MHTITLNDEFWFWRNIHSNTCSELEPCFLKNVSEYNFTDFTKITIKTTTDPTTIGINDAKNPEIEKVYCLMDSPHSSSFGHFFWESFIFLPTYYRLLKRIPNITFLIGSKQNFKRKILESYGFSFSHEIESVNNVVGFMPPITSLVTNKYSLIYRNALDEFHFEIQRDKVDGIKKDIFISYFPRHKTIDNYPYEGQDRSFSNSELVDFLRGRSDCIIVDSENSNSWEKEIDYVRRSKFLICHDGSSSAVLGFHANQSTIIALSNNVAIPSMRRFDKVDYIMKKIASVNEKFFVRAPDNNFSMSLLAPLLMNQIVTYPFIRNA